MCKVLLEIKKLLSAQKQTETNTYNCEPRPQNIDRQWRFWLWPPIHEKRKRKRRKNYIHGYKYFSVRNSI